MERIKQLTDLQTAVMNVLWQQDEATVAQVHASLQEERQLAFTTVATILSRLEKYGLLAHRTEGRQYVYRPLVSRSEVRRSQLTKLLNRFFQGNPADLVYYLINESAVDDEDIGRILALIESKEEKDGNQ
ncbi:MAG: BlaI/MecI/CopY family transcriptional regulator [Chloroflexota bacterium]|nr:BlaI/MecI/CopY family transcriptional regulator [Chloroflexota bacterium]